MKKILFYAMRGEKMCFQHVLMNLIDLHASGADVKLVFEAASIGLVPSLESEKNPLYLKAKNAGLIAGICLACSKVLGVFEQVNDLQLPMLDDMFGHAGMKPFVEQGYEVIVM